MSHFFLAHLTITKATTSTKTITQEKGTPCKPWTTVHMASGKNEGLQITLTTEIA